MRKILLPILALTATLTTTAQAEIKINPGPIEGVTSIRDNVRGQIWCEIIPITKTPAGPVGQIYNSTAVDDCTVEKSNSLDKEQLAKQMNVPMVRLNADRYWAFDKFSLFTAGETVDFGGVKAQWAATMTTEALVKIQDSPPYTAASIKRDSEWLWRKGKPVYLLKTPEGITWIMQVYTPRVDPSLSLETLDQLGSKLKLPAGWTFETKVLDKDLSIRTQLGHIMWDNLGGAWSGCGFDDTCNFIP